MRRKKRTIHYAFSIDADYKSYTFSVPLRHLSYLIVKFLLFVISRVLYSHGVSMFIA